MGKTYINDYDGLTECVIIEEYNNDYLSVEVQGIGRRIIHRSMIYYD